MIQICWRCKNRLVPKKLQDGINYGLFCITCSRFRKLRVSLQEIEGCGRFCRVDVRRSGALKRKVYLNEIV